MTCGNILNGPIGRRIWERRGCICEMSHSLSDAQARIDQISEGFEVLKYKPRTERVHLKHNACGKDKTYYLQQFVKSPVCPYCRKAEQTDAAVSVIMAAVGDGYAYVGTESLNKEKIFTVRHKICGIETSGTLRVFTGTKYIRPKRCPLCYRYEKGTRNLRQSDAGKAIEEMNRWFKDHKIWVLKYHADIKHNVLKKLSSNGLIWHIGFGVYASSPNVDVYEMLEERYLKDRDGNCVGQFIGDTAAFLAGTRPEPDIITLETSLVQSVDKRVYTICNRTVSVKGIKK